MNLAAIQNLYLLPQLYNQVTIPEAVNRELIYIDIHTLNPNINQWLIICRN
ncbi:hypothetical protein [Floridanema aerugineum]|uniref:Uncharacterized protein n=1 Tax=Floridaenema aerugineum BLCC-F46 TaxID=3153654 RepID=A0ABV4XCK6_9CYAN